MNKGVKIFVPSEYYVTSDYCNKGSYALGIDELDQGEVTEKMLFCLFCYCIFFLFWFGFHFFFF